MENYDRFDSENSGSGGTFVLGLLAGAVIGASLGMLFAPKAGADLRGQISEQANRVAKSARKGYKQAADVASDGYARAADAVNDGYSRAAGAASAASDAYKRASGVAKETYRQAADVAEDVADRARS